MTYTLIRLIKIKFNSKIILLKRRPFIVQVLYTYMVYYKWG